MRKKAEREGAGIKLPPENLHGYELLLLGEKCKIQRIDAQKIGYDQEKRIIYLPEKKSEERLRGWLKENAKRILELVTARMAEKMGVSYKSVQINSARGRWGSCSYDNALHYSFRLIYAPREIIEYVAVHELAHTRHKNHSPQFWAEVARYVPDWKERRKWLKLHGALMDVL